MAQVYHLRIVECVMHLKILGWNLKKLDNRSRPMTFIGYQKGSNGYGAYDASMGNIHLNKDVIFEEKSCN